MHFVQKGDRVYRTLEEGEYSDGFDDKDFQEIPPPPQQLEVPPTAHQEAPPVFRSFEHGQSSSSTSIEDRLLAYGEQLTALRADVNRIGDKVQTMDDHLQAILNHIEIQTAIYKDVMKTCQPEPKPDEPNT